MVSYVQFLETLNSGPVEFIVERHLNDYYCYVTSMKNIGYVYGTGGCAHCAQMNCIERMIGQLVRTLTHDIAKEKHAGSCPTLPEDNSEGLFQSDADLKKEWSDYVKSAEMRIRNGTFMD